MEGEPVVSNRDEAAIRQPIADLEQARSTTTNEIAATEKVAASQRERLQIP